MEADNPAEGDVPGNKEMDIEKYGSKDANPAVEEGGDLKIVKTTALENAASEELSSGRMAVLLFIASAIVMIDASVECHNADNCSNERGYAVAVGTVSTIVAFAFVYVKLFKSELYQSTRLVWALSFFVWWSAGVAVLTFRGPFLATGNGYFATWLSWFSSARLIYADVPFIQRRIQALLTMEDSNLQTLFLILLASIVELAAGGVACHNSSNCDNQTGMKKINFSCSLSNSNIKFITNSPFMQQLALLFTIVGSLRSTEIVFLLHGAVSNSHYHPPHYHHSFFPFFHSSPAFAVAIGAISILWVLPFMILSSLDSFELVVTTIWKGEIADITDKSTNEHYNQKYLSPPLFILPASLYAVRVLAPSMLLDSWCRCPNI
mmetsp:Transcript_34517/g.48097  ORF Transcript_34517/g.48097 Transcript_34517/m.48097 type:complete len:378 (-) Transcript_34517:1891-3024(-)